MSGRGYLFHTTSLRAAGGILMDGRVEPGDGGFVSFASVPFLSAELSGNEAILVFDRQTMSSQVEQVQYTEPWYLANTEKAEYVAGEGWTAQYTDPDECFDSNGWADDACLEDARAQAAFDAFAWKSDEQEWISKRMGQPVRFRPSDLKSIQVVRPSDVPQIEKSIGTLRGYNHVRVFLKGTKMASSTTTITRELAQKLKPWADKDSASALFQVVKAGMTGNSLNIGMVDKAVEEIHLMFQQNRSPRLRDALHSLELFHASDPFAKMARRVVARYMGKDHADIGKNRQAYSDLKMLVERGDLGESPEALILLKTFNKGGKAPIVAIEKLVGDLRRANGPLARRLLAILDGLVRGAYGYFG